MVGMTLHGHAREVGVRELHEEGSDLAAELWASARSVTSSILSHPEGRAAHGAARRSGRLSARQRRRAVDDFETVHAELVLIGLDAALARAAGALADDLGLRGYDAVRAATALGLRDDSVFVTWDVELAGAMHEAGCAVAPALS